MPSPDDCATLQAWFEGVDHVRAEAEAEWGAARLPLLADDILRAKFRRQQVKWSMALQAAWAANVLTRDQLAAVEEHAGGMKRAYAALDAAATEAGHRRIVADVWEVRLADGTIAALVRTNDEAAKVIAEASARRDRGESADDVGREVAVYTLAEVGHVIDALPAALQMAKVVFPGSKVLPQSEAGPFNPKRGDEIPFGDAGRAA